MTFDKRITIQVQNAAEEWADAFERPLLARINKTGGGQTFSAGADQYRVSLTFELRYRKALEDIAFGVQPFRVVYRGHTFKVTDYDDYMQQHRTVKLVGELYE